MQCNPLTLLVLDLGLHILNGVTGLHLQRDGLAGQSLHKDLQRNEVDGCGPST